MTTKFRAFKDWHGNWGVWVLDPTQTSDDPYEYTYNRYSDVTFPSEEIAQDTAAHLNATH
jgi:hypothetical protein